MYNLDKTAKEAAMDRVNLSMGDASYSFLYFKWWNMTGLNCAVWYCQKQFNRRDKEILTNRIKCESIPEQTVWLNTLFSLGRPSLFHKLTTGNEKIWVTDLTVAEKQRSGKFPKLFHLVPLYPEIAGITIKKVDGSDRPGLCATDLCVDVIITFAPPSEENTPSPVFHREQLPDWTAQQRHLYGRHTTGPLFTHWLKY